MKLLVIGPRQSGSDEARARAALQAGVVESYTVLTPRQGEGNVAAALRMLRESKKEDFDTVSAQDPFWSGLIAWRVARRTKARLNVQVHSDIDAQSFIKRVLARTVLRRADSVRVVSERICRQVERFGTKASITVLPVYIELPNFSSVVRREHTGKNILWIGRLEHEKDPLLAISVFREVLKQFPDARLKMLGSGSLREKAIQAANGLPIEEIFLGWQNPLVYLDTADVVLNTSPAESFGASIVEALAAGVPVVSMDVGVAKEAGANVVPREKLAETVAEMLQNPRQGQLKLKLFTQEEWVQTWLQSL